MKNVAYQKRYRKQKKLMGWRYFSVLVPNPCYFALKKFLLKWKSEHLEEWN